MFETDERNPDHAIDRTNREINFPNQNNKRLSNREKAQNSRVSADTGERIPIEPLVVVPQAEQYENKNAADQYTDICPSEETMHSY
jgi:RNA polymerase-binding transcription factor DksA